MAAAEEISVDAAIAVVFARQHVFAVIPSGFDKSSVKNHWAEPRARGR